MGPGLCSAAIEQPFTAHLCTTLLQVDAHLSYDAKACYDKAMRIIDMYAARGIEPNRVYIKLATTWAGVQACKKLRKEGVDCNMTLLFSFAQVGIWDVMAIMRVLVLQVAAVSSSRRHPFSESLGVQAANSDCKWMQQL